MSKLTELTDKLESLKKQIVDESKAALSETSKVIFEKYPHLESFSFKCYTPYFNDGDECVFSAHIDDPDINGEDGWKVGSDTDYSGQTSKPKVDLHPLYHAHKEIVAMLRMIPNASYKDLFGDHCKVTCKRDGVEVEEYDHN